MHTHLVQAVRPAPAWHGTASEFIHNDDLIALDNVVDILLLKLLGL